MGYNILLDTNHEPLNPEEFNKLITDRSIFIKQLVDDFLNFYFNLKDIQLKTIDEVAIKISSVYYHFCYAFIKPTVKDKINKYKMASLMELLIVKEQVLIHPDENKNREVNAIFGMMAAFSLIECMIQDATKSLFSNTHNAVVNKRIDQMLEDHQKWLETKYLNEMPVFINAQFFEFMQIIQSIPIQINGY